MSEEEVDVEMNDTVADVKIKATMIYTQLETENFCLMHKTRRLQENETILNILKQHNSNEPLAFTIKL